jgi:uncharacterized protein (DUF1697 family)
MANETRLRQRADTAAKRQSRFPRRLTHRRRVGQHLEREAGKRLGLQTDFFVRTVKEWEGVIAHNPFHEAAKNDASHLLVAVLKSAPTASQVKALETAIKGRERLSAYGRHAYIVYPDGIGTSKLTLPVIERHLGTRGTCRNWNTTLKMAVLASAQS